MRLLNGLLLIGVAMSIPVADDWPAALVKNVFSDDGTHFVRLIPGNNLGATVGFKGAASGRHGRAEFYVRQRDHSYKRVADVTLANPIAPVEALLSNNGLLITFDNWHNVGYGKVIAIYDERGRVVRSYELEQLFPKAAIDRVPTSESSRWWRCGPIHFVDPQDQRQVYVPEFSGGYFVFVLTTGGMTHSAGSAPCQPPPGPFSTMSR